LQNSDNRILVDYRQTNTPWPVVKPLLAHFKTRLETAKNPLLTAVKLAIAGNVIDLGCQ
jgi:uncharacterized protein with ATP-grasp and redox domains